MNKPKSTLAKVLYALINEESVNLYTFRGSSLRSRISNLRLDYGLKINSEMCEALNEFGNPLRYANYILQHNKKEARKIYETINKK
jgi:hypothetical protein